MRVEYQELMEKLGVGHILSPYETRPWFLHDAEQGITCSAEVRVGPGAADVEAEIQFLYDEDTESEEESSGMMDGGPEQILLMRFLPSKEEIWSSTLMNVKNEDYKNKIHSWGERGCEFFCSCIGALQMGELPNIDELIEQDLTDKKRGGRGRRGRVGKKGFKVEQKGVSMGMKN